MTEQERLDTLIPEAKQAMTQLIEAMTARNLNPYVGQTRRSPAQQQQAIKDGTTSHNQTVSWHELGRAVDFRARLQDGSGSRDDWYGAQKKRSESALRLQRFHCYIGSRIYTFRDT